MAVVKASALVRPESAIADEAFEYAFLITVTCDRVMNVALETAK